MELTVTNLERCIKLLRSTTTLETAAMGTNPADTAKEHYYLAAAAVYRELQQTLAELAGEAEITSCQARALAAKAEQARKDLKKQK